MFFEDSTRTRNSFALAAGRLSADVIEFTKKASAISKGETLLDTARNLEAMGIDIVVVRHAAGGTAKLLSRSINASIVNAGDGYNEHPTQALLDVYTIRKNRGSLDGLKIGIVGDIANSPCCEKQYLCNDEAWRRSYAYRPANAYAGSG